MVDGISLWGETEYVGIDRQAVTSTVELLIRLVASSDNNAG